MYIALLFHTNYSPLLGYPLSSKEVLDLINQILPQDVIDSLEKSGLDLKTSGNIQTTLKEVRRLLHQHENVSSLRHFLDSGMTKLYIASPFMSFVGRPVKLQTKIHTGCNRSAHSQLLIHLYITCMQHVWSVVYNAGRGGWTRLRTCTKLCVTYG